MGAVASLGLRHVHHHHKRSPARATTTDAAYPTTPRDVGTPLAAILLQMAEASRARVGTGRARNAHRFVRWVIAAAGVSCLLALGIASPRAAAEADQLTPRVEAPADLSDADRTRLTLARDTPPARDETMLARQYRGNTCTDPAPTPVPMWQGGTVGDRRRFKVLDERKRVYVDVQTTLQAASDHLLVYLQDGVAVAPEAIASSVDAFEKTTLPVLEATFGPMPAPGRITVFSGQVTGVGGYFSSSDLVPASLSPNSNERVMVYMNSDVLRPGQSGFDGVLAHEVQHFLHWLRHPQQDSWLNEGASELAMVLTGHAQASPVRSYLRRLETPVTGWAERPVDAVPHYGAASLLVRYLGFRVGGNDRLRAVIQTPGVSTQVVDRYLSSPTAVMPPEAPPRPSTFDDLFADFITATILNDPTVGDGRFAFGRDPLPMEKPSPAERLNLSTGAPGETAETGGDLAPYGTHLIEVAVPPRLPNALEVNVDGNATTRVIGESPPSGGPFWWGYPADEVDATLTRTIDLRGESTAALELDAWYDLEQDYDYAGVALSTDGGCTWRAITGTDTTDANPIGQNPGHAWTGRSGGGATARWSPMRFDLRSAAGHVAMIRVFQINDQAFHRAGLAVTNLRITTGSGGGTFASDADWNGRGFISTANRVAVQWVARAIVTEGGRTHVETIPVGRGTDGRSRGTLLLPASILGDGAKVMIAVSPMAPATHEPTDYRVTATSR